MFGLSSLFTFLAPYDCLLCGHEGSLLCAWCWPGAFVAAPDGCFNCHASTPHKSVCKNCRQATQMDYVWIGARYDGVVKRLLHQYKFERAKDAAGVLARLLAETAPRQPAGTIVTYIPTATQRIRERGFDHARQLAEVFARQQGLRLRPLLWRHGQQRQVGASRYIRRRQAEKTYGIVSGLDLAGANILLIDDIVTTGATLQAATKVLRAAGAKSVNALVVAQKQ